MPTDRTQLDDMRLTVVLIGPPGSGKGTQAVRLAERYGIPHISTGEILRAAVRARSSLGQQVAATLASGGLVSDSLMTDLVRERLCQPDARRGFVLDGFPRTAVQAHALDEMLAPAPSSLRDPSPASLIVVLVAVADEAIVAEAQPAAGMRVVRHHAVGIGRQRATRGSVSVLRRDPGAARR